MHILFILNDPAYGTERTYNGLRLANALFKKNESVEVTVFLLGDGVTAAKAGQQTPNGYYNLERMLKGFIARGGKVLLCETRAWTRAGCPRTNWSRAAAGASWMSWPR